MKRIVIMYDFFSEHGGLEKVMLFQAKTLKAKGCNVTFAFAFVDEKLKKEKLSKYNVIEYGKLPIKLEAVQISSTIFRNRIINQFKNFDLIICHSFPSSYVAYRIKKKFKIPYILHLHHLPKFIYNADLNWAKNDFKRLIAYFIVKKIFNKPFKKLDQKCIKNANKYFTASKSVQKDIKEVYHIDSKVIYPPLNAEFKIKKYNEKSNFVLSSGRVVKQKRLDWLIQALSKIKNKPKLVIAGECEQSLKSEFTELAKKLNVNLSFLGLVDKQELIRLYNTAKATISLCPKEGFGLSLVESIACGTPGISWKDGGGPEEIIVEDKNGYLAKPYDISDLAFKIEQAIKKKWNKIQVAKTVEKFNEDKIMEELIKEI